MLVNIISFLIVLSVVGTDDLDTNDHIRFCIKKDNEIECVSPEEMTLTRLDGGEVGQVMPIDIGGRILHLKTISLKPLVFEIEDFLTNSECDHIITLANKKGLEHSFIEQDKLGGDIYLTDFDGDNILSINEIKRAILYGYHVFLDDKDIVNLITYLDIDENKDNSISMEELKRISESKFGEFLKGLLDNHPEKTVRQSKQTWLRPDRNRDPIFKDVQKRLSHVVQLPIEMIKLAEFQVVNYGVQGHYNAHHDTYQPTPDKPCCHGLWSGAGRETCRICRYMTVLFYLNDVEGGGETAFPVANNETLGDHDEMLDKAGNLFKNCHDANVRVRAEKGKAIFWYNHIIDPETGWMGDRDNYTYHGGCPVTAGEKWIANFWIRATNSKAFDIKLMESLADPF